MLSVLFSVLVPTNSTNSDLDGSIENVDQIRKGDGDSRIKKFSGDGDNGLKPITSCYVLGTNVNSYTLVQNTKLQVLVKADLFSKQVIWLV